MKKFVRASSSIPCIHWRECSGCPLMEHPYRTQLEHKKEHVSAAYLEEGFFDQGLISRVLKPVRASPKTLAYRNKAKWILQRASDGSLKMGIYRAGTHEVVDIPTCSVHAPEINEVSAFVKSLVQKNNVPVLKFGQIFDGQPVLRYVIVRYSFREKKLLCVFVTGAQNVSGLPELLAELVERFQSKLSTVVQNIVQNINDGEGNVLLGEANRYHFKKSELTESMGSFRVPVGPLSFLQVNSSQASYLYKRVSQLLKGNHRQGLDLYSGVGLMAFHMASNTEQILAVEEVGAAALEAITAARRGKLNNVLQLCADAREGIKTFHEEFGIPDWVILNPPRKGCDPDVLRILSEKIPDKLVYVSCNPRTQARDLALLMRWQPTLKLKSLEPVDMFPQTMHIECIAYLENTSVKKVGKHGGKGRKGSKTLH
jgi:23S rRNA (uracil1939-C5)-methyltransferase